MEHHFLKYLRREVLPTTHCPGCGCGQVLNAFVNAIDDLEIDPATIISVTGIGCSSWIPSPYLKVDTLHTTHGRAVAFATGVKVMKPQANVVVIAGDGDLAGIGGNHLIHAARRNVGLAVFLVNNYIYGMTGGQVSPTTPYGVKTTTTPYTNAEYPLRIAELVAAAGANYVARWTTYHIRKLITAMKEALQKKGFAFVEIISQCPVSYGRRVGLRDGVAFMEFFKHNSVGVEKAREMTDEELEGKIVVGKLIDRERTEFTESLRMINDGRGAEALGVREPGFTRPSAPAPDSATSRLEGFTQLSGEVRVRIAGFGGQGIVMAGYVLGRAGILDGRGSLQTQSYGSESRGGATKSDVIISTVEILELSSPASDVLVAMSQPALEKHLPTLKDGGMLIYDSSLVKPEKEGVHTHGMPATEVAHNTFGSGVVANVIMLGYLVGLTGVVSRDSLRRAISEGVPPKTLELNLKALDEGFSRGAEPCDCSSDRTRQG